VMVKNQKAKIQMKIQHYESFIHAPELFY